MANKRKVSANYLEGVPVRNAGHLWRVKENGMVEIDMENKGFYHSIAQKFFKKPRVSHISLDEHGSVVWQSIDGKNNIMDIIRIMENEFPNEKDRMLDRIVTYMATLQNSGFVSIKIEKSKGAKS